MICALSGTLPGVRAAFFLVAVRAAVGPCLSRLPGRLCHQSRDTCPAANARMTLMSLLWAIAFGICPQRPSHSLFLGGQQMPIEARMAGMFAGFLIGAGYIAARGRGRALRLPGRWMTLLLLGFGALLGADGLNALFFDFGLPHLYTPYNPIRLATGLLTGLAMASFLAPTFNSTIWEAGLDVSPLTGLSDVLGAIAVEAVYFVAALSGSSLSWYPVS